MKKTNLVFLLADQFRADCLYAGNRYGVRTPNIDELAAESAVYRSAYTPMPVCAPVRQSLLSGRHPDAIGAFWNYDFFSTKTICPGGTWPEQLRERGYKGAYLGKWHCSPEYGPQDFGYTDVISWDGHKRLLDEKYPDVRMTGGWLGCESPIAVEDSQTHWLAAQAAEKIREYARTGDPFHIWVDWGIPHLPCQPSAPFSSMYDPASIAPWDGFDDPFRNKPYCQRQQAINWGLDGCAWEELSPMVARYFAMISQLDDSIGMILRAIREAGLWEDTMIVFTSDHGDMCGSHRMLDKHYVLFDDVTRIPLLVKAPGHAHYESDALVSGCLDTEATIRRVLSLPANPRAHGRPLPLRAEEDTERREYITSSANGQQFGLYCSRMITDGRCKYVWNMTDIDEFYDLSTDPGEIENRIGEACFAERIAQMRRALHAELTAHEDPFIGKGWLDRQLLEGRQHL
ncbi:MAG: sulfatase-like hydrolase/transferase [Eubacteriales bacterium]|nr:sulfatase-like hydrolase/transferase [Eubacteriales bacterium]